jgi:transcription elongation factor SPT6
VRFSDERLAALWESSLAAKEEMPEQPPLIRRAVALGRLALDPLAVLASLCGRVWAFCLLA